MNPGTAARIQAEEMHKLAFPESYEQKTDDVKTDTAHVEGTAPVVTETKTVEEDHKHKYDVLLGKYNAEVPRLHQQVRQLTEENTVLKNQITELRTAPVATSVEIPALAEKDSDGNALYRSAYVTDEMRGTDNYKYYFAEYGQTYAERQLESSVLAARSTVKPVEDRIETVNATSAEEQFNVELSRTCPAWQGLKAGVNVDPEFIAWLQGKIPGSRNTLHADLVDAYQTADAGRMTEIINLYLNQKKPTSAGARQIPEELIAPNKTGGGTQTTLDNAGGNVLRMADMEKLYEDYRQGRYRGKEAEYQKKKEEFMKAKSEGRLV